MTGKKLKFIGVCGTALIMFSTVTPASALLFGNNVTAQAATANSGYLKDATYEYGTFTATELTALKASSTDIGASTVGSSTLLTRLFPNATSTMTVREALGITDADALNYQVYMSTNLETNTTIDQLNQRTAAITATFTISNSDGSATTYTPKTATINIAKYNVTATALNKSVGDEYKISEGLKVTNLSGVELTAGTSASQTTYTVTDVTDGGTLAAGYVNATNYFNKTATNFKQTLQVTYLNTAGATVTVLVDRTVNVAASAQSMPYLKLASTAGTYYTNGQTVNNVYGYSMTALNQAPLGGTADYIKTNILSTTANTITVKNTVNSNDLLNVLPNSDNSGSTIDATTYTINADNVDLTKAGSYTYTLTVKNTAGISSTFTLPLVVTAADNMPSYSYDLGYSDTMTIPVNTAFNPLEGITFYEDDTKTNAITATDRIKYTSDVNTSVAGTYTVTYQITNKLGNTRTITRKVIVSNDAVTSTTVYRAYNPNNGDHLYATTLAEYNQVVAAGWTGEGIAFKAATTGSPVYRLYNPNTGEHFYVTNVAEYSGLMAIGWDGEGIAFYSTTEDAGNPIYRLFNPNSPGPGTHLFTASLSEQDMLVRAGWQAEGVAFYTVK